MSGVLPAFLPKVVMMVEDVYTNRALFLRGSPTSPGSVKVLPRELSVFEIDLNNETHLILVNNTQESLEIFKTRLNPENDLAPVDFVLMDRDFSTIEPALPAGQEPGSGGDWAIEQMRLAESSAEFKAAKPAHIYYNTTDLEALVPEDVKSKINGASWNQEGDKKSKKLSPADYKNYVAQVFLAPAPATLGPVTSRPSTPFCRSETHSPVNAFTGPAMVAC